MKFDNDFQEPIFSKGTVVPPAVLLKELKIEQEENARKAQWRHDWRIAVVSALIGAVFGAVFGYLTVLITTA